MSRARHAPWWGLVVTVVLLIPPTSAEAQFSGPCKVACALVLAVDGYAVGTGAVVAWGRLTGGISSPVQGQLIWGTGTAITIAAGVGLSGNGNRQSRAVYAAGAGVAAGAVLGLALGSLRSQSDGAQRLAATLIGAGAGALIGGIYGALSHDEPAAVPTQVPLFAFRWEF